MATAAKQAVVFGVLKACLMRRYVLPEVYDVMDKVGGLLVQSPSIPVRQQCASVLLQFLLDYPLGQKRLRQHLGFLLNNLQCVPLTAYHSIVTASHRTVTASHSTGPALDSHHTAQSQHRTAQSQHHTAPTQHYTAPLFRYPYPATREVVIELLHTVVLKFPVEVLDAHAEFLLLPTVLALVTQ
jgi:hypothetical protein